MLLLQAAATTHNVGGPSTAYLPVMVFFVFAVAFPVLPLILGRFLRPWKYQKDRCGRTNAASTLTGAHDRFTVRYYIVAMLFSSSTSRLSLLPWAIIFMGDDFSFTSSPDRDVRHRNSDVVITTRGARRFRMGVIASQRSKSKPDGVARFGHWT
jgi:NADH:ubiquinone oxidoreductase subunit 3 (subunit A)